MICGSRLPMVNGRNAVSVTVLRPLQRRFSRPKIASEQFGRRSRARGQVREHPAAVLDCDLQLIAFERNLVFILTA